MNRSLVPPVFFERGNNVKISPNHHIDMYELSKLGSQVENKCEHILHVQLRINFGNVFSRSEPKLISISSPTTFSDFCHQNDGHLGDRWTVKTSQVINQRVKASTNWWNFEEIDFFSNKVPYNNGWRVQPTDKISLLYKNSTSPCSVMDHPIRGWSVRISHRKLQTFCIFFPTILVS